MDTLDAERVERCLSNLKNYVVVLEWQNKKIEMWDTQHSMSVVVSSWDPKGLLSMIDMKIAEYVKHAFHAGMLRQAVGSASAYPLLVAGSVGLFGASVVMKEAQ